MSGHPEEVGIDVSTPIHDDLPGLVKTVAAGEPITEGQLRTWAAARGHFDATREQEAVGLAVLRVLDDRTRFRSALRAIAGPTDDGEWIHVYRSFGGGYEGLQAIARNALRGDL